MRIAVIGTGYVGLVSGACFAATGNHETCVDVDAGKLARLRRGELPIYEPGLEPVAIKAVADGLLHFTDDLGAALRDAEIVFIAVGTPPGDDGSADLRQVLAVAKAIGERLDHYAVIVDKSTVPVGTADQVRTLIAAELRRLS